jgi:hypothetical protein
LGVRDFGNGCEGFVQVILPKDIGEKLPLSEITGPLITEKVEAAALETMKGAHQSTLAETATSKIAKRLGLEPSATNGSIDTLSSGLSSGASSRAV